MNADTLRLWAMIRRASIGIRRNTDRLLCLSLHRLAFFQATWGRILLQSVHKVGGGIYGSKDDSLNPITTHPLEAFKEAISSDDLATMR